MTNILTLLWALAMSQCFYPHKTLIRPILQMRGPTHREVKMFARVTQLGRRGIRIFWL